MYTLGIEEEFFIIDPQTYALVSMTDHAFFDECSQLSHTITKSEYYDCQLEIGTPICKNIKELNKELSSIHEIIHHCAAKRQLQLLAVSTHPSADWKTCTVTLDERYRAFQQILKHSVRRLLISSLQFHVGVAELDMRIRIINYIRQYLPHLLALSTSSPFWQGENTELMSYRTLIYDNLPRSSIPPYFDSLAEFQYYMDIFLKTNTIFSGAEIWLSIRPHHKFPTLECRICDNPTRPKDIIALGALFQALVMKIHQKILNGTPLHVDGHLIIQENKWRAARYGLNGKFIDTETGKEIEIKNAIYQMLEYIDDVVDELDSREEINHIHTILEQGTSADAQLKVYQETGKVEDVIKELLKMQR